MWGWFLFDHGSCYMYFWVNQIFVKVSSDNQKKLKHVSVAEVYTTKISCSLFLQKIKEILLVSFCFCYYNEYPMKQTAFLYLKLLFKPVFLVCFCYFWKANSFLVLNLFISEYLGKIFPWKETKLAFPVKFQIEYLCFCLK